MIIKSYVVPHPPIILPEVGRGKEREIQKTIDSMNRMSDEVAQLRPDTIIITSPHTRSFYDVFYIERGQEASGNFNKFGVFNIQEKVLLDSQLAEKIIEEAEDIPIVYEERYSLGLDHGSLIPIRFIHKNYTDFKVVLLGLSGLAGEKHFKLGQAIERASRKLDRRTVFIASGDLSHVLKANGPYGFKKEGPKFDKKIVDILSNGNFAELFTIPDEELEKAAQCGLKSFQIMAGALNNYRIDSEFYSYQDTFGVGYGVFAFNLFEKINPYVALAKAAIEEYVKNNNRIPIPESLPEEMLKERAGTFVTLYKNGELRGCIGTIGPTKVSLAHEIIANAISSATRDPRFPPVKEAELDELEISVDVLKVPEKIGSFDELDTDKYGIIVSSGYKRGLLLPMIEGIDNPEMQVEIAKRKAGIFPGESYELERFEVIRYE